MIKTRNVKGNKRIGSTQCVLEKRLGIWTQPTCLAGIFKDEMSWKNIFLKNATNQFNLALLFYLLNPYVLSFL